MNCLSKFVGNENYKQNLPSFSIPFKIYNNSPKCLLNVFSKVCPYQVPNLSPYKNLPVSSTTKV